MRNLFLLLLFSQKCLVAKRQKESQWLRVPRKNLAALHVPFNKTNRKKNTLKTEGSNWVCLSSFHTSALKEKEEDVDLRGINGGRTMPGLK